MLGTGRNDPGWMLEDINGCSPELSVTSGIFHVTLTSVVVALSITMSLGQFVNTGGSSSKSKVTVYVRNRL